MTFLIAMLHTLIDADQGDAERSSGALLHSHMD
jgi:hypothetical protein